MWIKSSKPTRNNISPVYLIRQYMQSSLHDRLSTRPFLTQVEKLWLMYQLFKALEVCHMSHGIIHGDIKPENVMCTSWNWLVLTDFGTFKPANLPDDDPTDFQFYFDTMGRNSCYIAPERFYRREVKPNPGDGKYGYLYVYFFMYSNVLITYLCNMYITSINAIYLFLLYKQQPVPSLWTLLQNKPHSN